MLEPAHVEPSYVHISPPRFMRQESATVAGETFTFTEPEFFSNYEHNNNNIACCNETGSLTPDVSSL
jgi:hypothetical protein